MGLGIAQGVVGWLGVLLALTGLVASSLHLGRTRWAMLLAGGFALQTLAMGFTRVVLPMFVRGTLTGGGLEAAFLLAAVLGVAGSAGLVGGVAGVLAELRRGREQTPV
jgi:hypothetical protein